MKPRILVAGIALALLGLGGVARADEFITTGSPVILELPLENEDTSTATAQGVRLVATFEEVTPAGLASYLSVDEAGSVLGPVAIVVGAANTQTLKAKIVLAAGAPDGSFKVRLHPTFESDELFVSPDPETLDTSVKFKIERSGPKVAIQGFQADFRGLQAYTPTTTARDAIFSVEDSTGLATPTLPGSPAIVEVLVPAGAHINALPPGLNYLSVKVSSLTTGLHEFIFPNTAGEQTSGKWKIDSLAANPNTSAATYFPTTNDFSATFSLSVDASGGIDKIIEYNSLTNEPIRESGNPIAISVPRGSSQTFRFLFRDSDGKTALQNISISQGAIAGHLRAEGTQTSTKSLSFAGPTPYSGYIAPGIIRTDISTAGTVGIISGINPDPNPPAIPVSTPVFGTYQLKGAGESLWSGTVPETAENPIPTKMLSVSGEVGFELSLVRTPDTNMIPFVEAGVSITAMEYSLSTPLQLGAVRVLRGSNQSVPLGNGASVSNFTTSSMGDLARAALTTRALEPEFINLNGNQVYELFASSVFYSPNFTLHLAFDPQKHTVGKTVYIARIDSCIPILYPASIDNNKVSAVVSDFGRYAVVESKFQTGFESGVDDCHFKSDQVGVTADHLIGGTNLRQVYNVFGSLGLQQIGAGCKLGPTRKTFSPDGVITSCHSPEDLAQLSDDSLTLYQFNEFGVREKLNGQFVDRERGIVAATVSHFSSEFSAFKAAPAVQAADLIAPISSLAVDGQAQTATEITVTTVAALSIMGTDPAFPGAPVSGLATSFFLIDLPFVDSVTTPDIAFGGPFSLSEGSHTLTFYSIDRAGNVESRKSVSLFAIPPPPADPLPPRTSLSISLSSGSSSGLVYVSSTSRFGLTAVDDRLVTGDGLGSGTTQTFYAYDGNPYQLYASSFTFPAQGSHSLLFYSVDFRGNTETPIAQTIFTDRTAPTSQAALNGTQVTLSAADPNAGGNASGVARIRHLIDVVNPTSCQGSVENLAAQLGTCENPWYAGPFNLTSGSHTIWYQAIDGVGNTEVIRSTGIYVQPNSGGDPAAAGGLGIGRDPYNAFWTVNGDDSALFFAHADSAGAFISSAALEGAGGGLPWSVLFDAGGRAYAVGIGEGANSDADLAVYKASPAGDAIETRTSFDSGYANNDLVFDAKAPGWIAGAAQIAGPADFEQEGDRRFVMALWKFDPTLGSVSLTTTTSRDGFDFASGVAVDPDGSVWIVGYSAGPSAPSSRGLDLVVRHYAADGHTLLGAYLKPGYLDGLDGTVTARIYATASAVYVAAPRIAATGVYDLAFLRFDKATGEATVETVWKAPGGDGVFPSAILTQPSGLLVVGGIGAEGTVAALWRYGLDGSFTGATLADAGGARGAVMSGSELWLTVEGSTSPYRVTSEQSVTGTLLDISTPAPSGYQVSPASGPIGVPFTISGAGFGPYNGSNTRVKFGAAAAALSVWNDTTISGTIPGLSTGTYAVAVERQNASSVTTVSGGTFLISALAVTSVSPSSGPIGTAFTLLGPGFGPYNGANTSVLVDGSTASLSVWNDAKIVGTVPGNLTPGDKAVVVRRVSGAGISESAPASFAVTGLSAYTMSPSSGPIGVPFTINGASFGVYNGANTRVRFGVSTAALSVWNDSTITGTVPALATGTVEVVIERQQGVDVASASAGSFTTTALVVASVAPSSGPIGTAFTLLGPGFGPYNGTNTTVLLDGTTAALSVWNDAKIVGTVPGALTPGVKALIVRRLSGAGISESAPAAFEVTGMTLGAIAPSSGPIGAPFTITGSQFGAYNGSNTRVKFGGVLAALSVWNDTTITGTVPALPTGTVDVVVERQQGAGVASSTISSFTVLALSISSVTPASGPIGVPFTIKGSGFGPYNGSNTRALIGGVIASLSVWNDTTVTGTIPNLAPGSQPVWLERSSGAGVSASATFYFEVTVPAVATLTPSSAPIGAPFTITGANFGPYNGANTRVKFSGIVAPLSVWNDTTISGTVPGAASAGAAVVVVERVAGAGLSASATQAFTILMPSISTVSPGFGPAGTVVTLTGTGFGPYAGSLTKVLVGGATVPLSVWNDSTIRWTVPASLADGDYPVIVERSPAGGTVDSASATFSVGTGYSGASFGFATTMSLASTPDSHFEGDLALSSATGGRIDTPAKAAVDIPPNAMPEDLEITLKRLHGDGLRARAAEEIKKRAAGEPIEFGPEGTRFNTPVTIELPYDPSLTKDEDKIAIHYYNALRREWEELPSEVDKARRVVKAKTDHFSIYQPMGLAPTTAAQDEFYFRDQYAFPNPSRNGALITFRIQPGLSDTVEIRVYDVAGRKIHESSDFTFQGAFDDGNGKGAQNTYDHAWSVGGVGSGVYTYVIKASRASNKPIVKSGKVGVIK